MEWSLEQYGSTIRLTSKLRHLSTNRMWQLTGGGESIDEQKQYFLQQMEEAKNDLITRLEFIYMAMNGDLDDDIDGVAIEWKRPTTS